MKCTNLFVGLMMVLLVVLVGQVGIDSTASALPADFDRMGYWQAESDPSCSDSDGGQDPNTAGYVQGIGPNGWPYTRFDVCETGDYKGYVKEYFCVDTSYSAGRYNCENGCMDGACLTAPPSCIDTDGDTYAVEGGACGLVDCDDNDPSVHPNAQEDCTNAIDDNCNGLIDAEDPACMPCTDADGDGYAVEGGACGDVDCDDNNPEINPGAREICDNNVDDNCNGQIDTDDPACVVSTCTDSDGGLEYEQAGSVEGIGLSGFPYTKYDICESESYLKEYYCVSTTPIGKLALCANDCSDGACLQTPPLVCTDADGDSFAVEGGDCGLIDCDDANPQVHPDAAEDCGNTLDDNCNGRVDDADRVCNPVPNVVFVGWDGTQRDHFWQCFNEELAECESGLPNIAQLDIYSSTVTNGETETKPGWTQLFTGYNADVTGVYNNGDYQPIPEGYTLFEKVENHFGVDNVVTMFISGKAEHTGGACIGEPTTKNGLPVTEDQGQPWCITKEHLDYYENGSFTNPTIGNRALELLEQHQHDQILAAFIFRNPDVLGHLAGEDSVHYSQGIVDDDYWLGKIVEKLKNLGIYEQTLVYVLSDHGFGEGLTTHGNAPYTIMATNDSAVYGRNNVDRKDIAPTILERYAITTEAIDTAPPVNGYSLYSMLPFSSVPEGEAFLDYPGAPVCSVDLSLIGIIRPLGTTCVAPTGGIGDNSGYCTNCGNGICELPENRCNCFIDCPR